MYIVAPITSVRTGYLSHIYLPLTSAPRPWSCLLVTEYIHSPCIADISVPLMVITSATDTLGFSLVPGAALSTCYYIWHLTVSSHQHHFTDENTVDPSAHLMIPSTETKTEACLGRARRLTKPGAQLEAILGRQLKDWQTGAGLAGEAGGGGRTSTGIGHGWAQAADRA